MRKLLNTIYVTNENTYLTLDSNNLVCKADGEIKLKIPFDNIENIVCFSYLGCSPALMGACVEKQVPINFISPYGKFWAKVCGETKGNVFLRVAQIDCFRENALELSKREVIAKISNNIQNMKRSIRDNPRLAEWEEIAKARESLVESIEKAQNADSLESLLGIEGNAASAYFKIFSLLITNNPLSSTFSFRTKRPPLDPVNAMLSFVYTLETADCASALETVGLDSYIGFYHTLRSGRASLACDMTEEFRGIGERFVLTLLNLQIISEKDFDRQVSGAVWLNKKGKQKLLTRWQEKKRSEMYHPIIKERIPFGLLPYVQSNLLAKYVRGENTEYIPYLLK